MFILFGRSQTRMVSQQIEDHCFYNNEKMQSSIIYAQMCQSFTRLPPNKNKNRSPTSLKMDSFQPA